MSGIRKELIAIVLVVSATFAGATLHAIERPAFEVVDQIGEVEIRRYQTQLVAQTVVTGPFSEAGNQGFRRLAGYIFGDNIEEQKIAMTAPVTLERDTAPSPDSQYRVTFNMPAEYARAELPTPDDRRVAIAELPERYLAVLRYRGSWSEDRYRQHETKLLSQIEKKSAWSKRGEPSWARYNPPFTPWFMRTNEVAVTVVPVNQAEQ